MRIDRLWITAAEQTQGRGRRGRAWSSPPGNLHASLFLNDPAPSASAAQLSFVAALAVADAIAVAAPPAAASLALKWPNDVLIGGAKVCGLLVEGLQIGDRFCAVVGCGINVAYHPPDTPYPAVHLAAIDPSTHVSALFRALADAFARRLAEWNRGAGFAALRAAWLAKAVGLGGPIVVRLPGEEAGGFFEALDPDGHLILREPSGLLRTIAAGDVFFRPS